jgi:hypothetical protein
MIPITSYTVKQFLFFASEIRKKTRKLCRIDAGQKRKKPAQLLEPASPVSY